MATKARKKKKEPEAERSSGTCMVSSSNTCHFNSYKGLPVFVLVVIGVGVMLFLGMSSTSTLPSILAKVDNCYSKSRSPKISVIQVLNVFPHDSDAFTQSSTTYAIQVLNEFAHDRDAFTQATIFLVQLRSFRGTLRKAIANHSSKGLLYAGNGTLFESTGLYGKSSVRRVALRTGKVEALQKMDSSYFGEGLTLLGERLFQVTWLTKTGFIYDRNNLSKIEKFNHQMQDGWGLATNGEVLFGSDGTSTLYKLDPRTFKVIGKHIVKYNSLEVNYLNELEYVNGEIWANVWQTDCIARISQEDGAVLGWILLENLRKGLIAAGNYGIDVLNGIAWDRDDNRLFVTGKLWPKLYEIKLHPAEKHFDDGVVEQLCIPRGI